MDIDAIVQKALSRRGFLAGAGSAAAATLVAGCSDAGSVVLPTTSTSYTDTDILNFALNLEYLEAEFYTRAATGSGLISSDTGSSPGTITLPSGAGKVPNLTTFQQNFLDEVAYTEQQHVRALRTALGSAAISRPALDYNAGFTGGVTAANAISNTAYPAIPTTFSPFASYDAFIVGALFFEEIGVTAYNGAAPLISTAGIAAGILANAAGILAVEAYHAGSIRAQLFANTATMGATAYPYAGYYNRLSLLKASLGGGNETQIGPYTSAALTVATVPTTGSTIVAADSNALAYHRTTDQVLHLAYANTTVGTKSGGFFPSGLNGNISVVMS